MLLWEHLPYPCDARAVQLDFLRGVPGWTESAFMRVALLRSGRHCARCCNFRKEGETAMVYQREAQGSVEKVYIYDEKMAVHSGANMRMPDAFPFEMRYTVVFEKGCLLYSTSNSPALMEVTADKQIHPEIKQTDGYHEEIAYLVRCIENNELPAVVTPESAAYSIALAEAEIKSVETGKVVEL